MSVNTFGRLLRFTTWGESHGPALGAVVDGCPPGLALDEAALQPFLGCFALSQQFSSGVCEGLDSWSCSSRSDCIALHQEVCDAPGSCWPQFFECVSENR